MTVHELIHTVSINDVREEICKIANTDASQQYEKLDSFLMKPKPTELRIFDEYSI